MAKLEKVGKLMRNSRTFPRLIRAYIPKSNTHTVSTLHIPGIRNRKKNKAQCLHLGLLRLEVCLDIILQLKKEKVRMRQYSVASQGPDSILWASGLQFHQPQGTLRKGRNVFSFLL